MSGLDGLAHDIAEDILASDVIRDIKARAWDEGYSHAFDFGPDSNEVRSLDDNPYRRPPT